MTTRRALSHLDALIELTERADRQIAALATTLTSVIEQIDAVTKDADQEVVEVLIEEAIGKKNVFRLSRMPVKINSLTLYLDDGPVLSGNYELDLATGVITLSIIVPIGREIRAEYTILGLSSQVEELLAVMPDLDITYFAAHRVEYQAVITWIRGR